MSVPDMDAERRLANARLAATVRATLEALAIEGPPQLIYTSALPNPGPAFAALDALEAQLERADEAIAEIEAEIERMDDVWQQHSNADDYPRILQADAHLNGLKFARAALAARGVVGGTPE